jgi:hypothetical protein
MKYANAYIGAEQVRNLESVNRNFIQIFDDYHRVYLH